MSQNPYKQDDLPPELTQSVCAFVDILGYQSLIDDAQGSIEQHNLLIKLHKALSFSRKWLDDGFASPRLQQVGDKDDFFLKGFTDNVVIGWPVTDGGDGTMEMEQALVRLAYFQLDMVNAGFFVRGAISVGSLYLDETMVFGEALSEAYKDGT